MHAHGRHACQPRRELQDKGCSRSAASVSLRRGGRWRHLLRVRECDATGAQPPAHAPSRAPSHVHASVPTPARRPLLPLLPSGAFRLRASQGPLGVHQNEETPEAVGDGGERTCPLSRDASPITRTFVMKGAYQSYYMRWNTQYRI